MRRINESWVCGGTSRGLTGDQPSAVPQRRCWGFSLLRNEFHRLPSLHRQRFFHGLVRVAGTTLAIGGSQRRQMGVLSSVESLSDADVVSEASGVVDAEDEDAWDTDDRDLSARETVHRSSAPQSSRTRR